MLNNRGSDGITLADFSRQKGQLIFSEGARKNAEQTRRKKIAILVTDGFEQSEMTEPKKALENAGAKAFVISPAGEQVRGWNHTEWGEKFPVDVPLDGARAADYTALVLPGGVMNPDFLRWNPRAVAFVKAIC